MPEGWGHHGKGFEYFMRHKDFHPRNYRNLKMVYDARAKQKMIEEREEVMRAEYIKEQELRESKALLGDKKAQLGLSFMYEPPAGAKKDKKDDEDQKEEGPWKPFEWQRKYNAPREEWDKDKDIRDNPFGILVKYVRCLKCQVWGHFSTDVECPYYNMSGDYKSGPGYSTNPSDLLKELWKEREMKAKNQDKDQPCSSKSCAQTVNHVKPPEPKEEQNYESESEDDWVEANPVQLTLDEMVQDMKDEHQLKLKDNLLDRIRTDDRLLKLTESILNPHAKQEGKPKTRKERIHNLRSEVFKTFIEMDEEQKAQVISSIIQDNPTSDDTNEYLQDFNKELEHVMRKKLMTSKVKKEIKMEAIDEKLDKKSKNSKKSKDSKKKDKHKKEKDSKKKHKKSKSKNIKKESRKKSKSSVKKERTDSESSSSDSGYTSKTWLDRKINRDFPIKKEIKEEPISDYEEEMYDEEKAKQKQYELMEDEIYQSLRAKAEKNSKKRPRSPSPVSESDSEDEEEKEPEPEVKKSNLASLEDELLSLFQTMDQDSRKEIL